MTREAKYCIDYRDLLNFVVHIVSPEMEFDEHVEVVKDLTASFRATCSSVDAAPFDSVICEAVGTVKLYLALPDDIRKKLQTDLPEMSKKVARLESEIEKIKGRMNSEAYQNKSASAKDMDITKVSKSDL